MFVYVDESGDLGWSFDKPYMKGGSSRYLTIGILAVPKSKANASKRVVRKLYKQLNRNPEKELKAADLESDQRIWMATKIAHLAAREKEIKLISITVRKGNVQQHLREDPNKLYNYMIRLALVSHISGFPSVEFVPDKRTVKVSSGNSLVDYLQIYLWYEMNVQTKIIDRPQESHKNLNLQFIDFLTNFIWRRYELNDSGPHNIIRPYVEQKQLFF